MRKYPRIEIDQKAYDGLQIEAVLQHRTIREIATEALLSHISKEALSVLDHKTIGPETTSPKDIATKRPLDHRTAEEKAGSATVADLPDKEVSIEARTALSFILEELEKGNEPTVNEIADKMGLTTTGLGMALSKCGIKAKNTHRDNKTVRIYTRPMKAKIEEVLETTK